MPSVAQRNPPRMSVEMFRDFYATRPDEESWQLIDGVAVMFTGAPRCNPRRVGTP